MRAIGIIGKIGNFGLAAAVCLLLYPLLVIVAAGLLRSAGVQVEYDDFLPQKRTERQLTPDEVRIASLRAIEKESIALFTKGTGIRVAVVGTLGQRSSMFIDRDAFETGAGYPRKNTGYAILRPAEARSPACEIVTGNPLIPVERVMTAGGSALARLNVYPDNDRFDRMIVWRNLAQCHDFRDVGRERAPRIDREMVADVYYGLVLLATDADPVLALRRHIAWRTSMGFMGYRQPGADGKPSRVVVDAEHFTTPALDRLLSDYRAKRIDPGSMSFDDMLAYSRKVSAEIVAAWYPRDVKEAAPLHEQDYRYQYLAEFYHKRVLAGTL